MAGRGGGEGEGELKAQQEQISLIWDKMLMSWVILFKCNSIPNRGEIKQRHSLDCGIIGKRN